MGDHKNGNHRGRLLVGKKAITDYLGVGDSLFYELINAGMLARAFNKRWMAHTDNIDDFLRRFTACDNRKMGVDPDAE
ncbi:MAG: hypothetical protein MUC33_01400 [Desulfobacterales bacterium]|jgi:hypothetical protein|nr:hypothetical protein [Desulfobacterales bacterium]MCU0601299.1 hypothetical protein [Desulfobacterales bacterium]